MTIFIDASVFCAYANKDDVHHEKAVIIINDVVAGKYEKAITTDYVFDEVVTVVLRRSNKRNAVEIGGLLLGSEVFMAKIDASIFQQAWKFFKEHEGLSFTDCTIVAFMKSFSIDSLATFDKSFKMFESLSVVGC